MTGGHNASKLVVKLYVDEHCELLRWARTPISQPWPFLLPYINTTFYELTDLTVDAKSIVVISDQQLKKNTALVRNLIETQWCTVVFANPLEGGETLERWVNYCRLGDLADDARLKIISGGEQKSYWDYFCVDNFVLMLLDQPENLALLNNSELQSPMRPYDFLYLSGRARKHRVLLRQRMLEQGLLQRALWSNLDPAAGEVRFLPQQYEFPLFSNKFNTHGKDYYAIKHQLFDVRWGEVYINASSYNDTYFSVVSETCFDTDKTFRTEKLWKPMLMKHPFVVVSNAGYLARLRDLGFETFGSVWPEHYDDETDHDTRMEKILQLISELTRSDLADLAQQCQPICEHNQQHLLAYRQKLIEEIPEQMMEFLRRA